MGRGFTCDQGERIAALALAVRIRGRREGDLTRHLPRRLVEASARPTRCGPSAHRRGHRSEREAKSRQARGCRELRTRDARMAGKPGATPGDPQECEAPAQASWPDGSEDHCAHDEALRDVRVSQPRLAPGAAHHRAGAPG